MNSDPAIFYLYISLAALGGSIAGALLVYLFAQKKRDQLLSQQAQQFEQNESRLEEQHLALRQQYDQLLEQANHLREQQALDQRKLGQLSQQSQQLEGVQQEKLQWQHQFQSAQQEAADLKVRLESQSARFEQEQLASREKINLLTDAEKRLQEQFENLANKIFEQKNEKFSQTSKAGLDALLSPLKEQIEGFKKQVTDQYVREGQERASLKTEILGLKELNQKITEEASALTRALKGDNKKQGNWGEVVLERILKESGLREGHEFNTQVSLKNDEGKQYQPDVVVHLPNDKDIVIDSKMSLSAYERYFNEQENEVERQQHLQDHIQSLKNHIRELGKKDYQDLQGLRTLDYVLMFIPVESAFLLAIDEAPELVKLALDNNIMLVSPTNLLVALRTINNIWQYEYQNQNAQNIAKKAADMYDKFVLFVNDMEGLGTSLQTVQKRYDGAMNKLSEGRGNLVRKAEEFQKLGIQSKKKLPEALVEKATEEEHESE